MVWLKSDLRPSWDLHVHVYFPDTDSETSTKRKATRASRAQSGLGTEYTIPRAIRIQSGECILHVAGIQLVSTSGEASPIVYTCTKQALFVVAGTHTEMSTTGNAARDPTCRSSAESETSTTRKTTRAITLAQPGTESEMSTKGETVRALKTKSGMLLPRLQPRNYRHAYIHVLVGRLVLAVEVQYFIPYKYTLECLPCLLWLIFNRQRE